MKTSANKDRWYGLFGSIHDTWSHKGPNIFLSDCMRFCIHFILQLQAIGFPFIVLENRKIYYWKLHTQSVSTSRVRILRLRFSKLKFSKFVHEIEIAVRIYDNSEEGSESFPLLMNSRVLTLNKNHITISLNT